MTPNYAHLLQGCSHLALSLRCREKHHYRYESGLPNIERDGDGHGHGDGDGDGDGDGTVCPGWTEAILRVQVLPFQIVSNPTESQRGFPRLPRAANVKDKH